MRILGLPSLLSLSLAFASNFALCGNAAAAEPAWQIRHVTVIPADTDEVLPDRSVLIRNGHIEAIVADDGRDSAKGVQVISVTTDENQRKDFQEFRKKYGATYPMGSVGNQEAYRFFGLSVMRPFYVPTFAFIDKNGVIRERFIGGLIQNNPNAGPAAEYAELSKHIEGLLKVAPAKPAAAVRPVGAPAATAARL